MNQCLNVVRESLCVVCVSGVLLNQTHLVVEMTVSNLVEGQQEFGSVHCLVSVTK